MSVRFSVLFASFKANAKLALPMMLTNMLGMGFSIVDTAVAGHLSASDLATVSVASSIFWLVMIPATSLLGGFQILMTRAAGRRDYPELARQLVQALVVALTIACLVIPLMFFVHWLYTFSLESDLQFAVKAYLYTLVPGAVAMMLWTPLHQYWQSRSVVAPWTLLTIALQPVNYFLDVSLSAVEGSVWGIPVFELLNYAPDAMTYSANTLGAVGIGLSTSACKILELLAVMLYTAVHQHQVFIRRSAGKPLARRMMVSTLRVGLPIGLHSLADLTIFGCCTYLIASMGASALSTHQILFTINCAAYLAMDGWSTATAIRLGHLIGRGANSGRRFIYEQFAVFIALSALASMGIIAGKVFIIQRFTNDYSVYNQLNDLWWLLIVFFLLDVIQNFGRNILQALGHTHMNFKIFFVGFFCTGIGAMCVLVLGAGLGLKGVWLGLCFGMVVCVVGYTGWFFNNVLTSSALTYVDRVVALKDLT